MKNEHITEMDKREGSVVVPLNGRYDFLDDLYERGENAEGIRFFAISAEELSFITGDFGEELLCSTGILTGPHEGDFIKGDDIQKLIDFCAQYRDQAPTLYEAALFARDNGRLMMVNL